MFVAAEEVQRSLLEDVSEGTSMTWQHSICRNA